MKTRAIQAIFLASILTLIWGSAAWAAERSRERSQQRVQKQTRRVEKGVRNNNNPRYTNPAINTNQSRVQRTYDSREKRQMQRIRKGVRNGEITRKEYRRLNREQRRFDRTYDRAASDGYLNRHERKRLHNMQDRASRHINRAMHNKATRYRHHYWHHRKRHPSPVVYNYYNPYPTESYSTDAYEFSGSIHEPGWTLAFSTAGSW
jgi:hypothetical protein